jgi:phage tail tape-measure protein
MYSMLLSVSHSNSSRLQYVANALGLANDASNFKNTNSSSFFLVLRRTYLFAHFTRLRSALLTPSAIALRARNCSTEPGPGGARSLRIPQVGRPPSALGGESGGGRGSQAVKPARPIASHQNTPESPSPSNTQKRRQVPRSGERWLCGGWAARGARCSRSPTSGGGRPTPGPPSATPSSPPR